MAIPVYWQQFKAAGREDLVNQNKKEVEILSSYMPEEMSLEELNRTIDKVFEEVKPTSSKDMGLIMKEVTHKLKGKCDMSMVSSMIKEKLNNI